MAAEAAPQLVICPNDCAPRRGPPEAAEEGFRGWEVQPSSGEGKHKANRDSQETVRTEAPPRPRGRRVQARVPAGRGPWWPGREELSMRPAAAMATASKQLPAGLRLTCWVGHPRGFLSERKGRMCQALVAPTLGARTTRCPQGGSRTPRLSSRQACASPWPTSLQGGDGQVGWALPGGVCTRRQQTRQRTRRPQCGSRLLGQRSWCHLPRNAGSLPRLVLPASGASIPAALTGRGKTHISCSSRGLGRKPCRAGQKVFFLCVKNGQALKGRAESRCSGFSPRSGAGLAQVPPSLRRNGSSHGCR